MPQLTKLNVQVIKRTLDDYITHVKLNQTWEFLHREYRVGRRDHNSLILSVQDRARLRDIVLKDTGINIDEALPVGLRTAVASHMIDEKWASNSIQQHRIYAASRVPIAVTEGAVNLNGDCVAWMDWRQLSLERIDTVVVVENLEAIAHWGGFMLPLEVENALAIYRGHDLSTQGVASFLAVLPSTVKVIWFVDFDPAGFVIANAASRCDALLIPCEPLALKDSSHKKRLHTQWARYHNIGERLPVGWIAFWNLMIEHQIAISQEALCAKRVPLCLLAKGI